jgi:hypothetical protein
MDAETITSDLAWFSSRCNTFAPGDISYKSAYASELSSRQKFIKNLLTTIDNGLTDSTTADYSINIISAIAQGSVPLSRLFSNFGTSDIDLTVLYDYVTSVSGVMATNHYSFYEMIKMAILSDTAFNDYVNNIGIFSKNSNSSKKVQLKAIIKPSYIISSNSAYFSNQVEALRTYNAFDFSTMLTSLNTIKSGIINTEAINFINKICENNGHNQNLIGGMSTGFLDFVMGLDLEAVSSLTTTPDPDATDTTITDSMKTIIHEIAKNNIFVNDRENVIDPLITYCTSYFSQYFESFSSYAAGIKVTDATFDGFFNSAFGDYFESKLVGDTVDSTHNISGYLNTENFKNYLFTLAIGINKGTYGYTYKVSCYFIKYMVALYGIQQAINSMEELVLKNSNFERM